jgi:flagellin
MSLSILNNPASLAAQSELGITNVSLQNTLFQLSSGSRINSGADDAAGLAIADGLKANITALTQSSRNAHDGVGQLQVADGALAQVTTLLDRAVTLATESANGTVSDSQRTALDAEYTAIKNEIDRIGSTTTYNGTQVFTSSPISLFLSDSGVSSTIQVTTGTLSAAGLLGGSANASLAFSGTPADGDQITIGGTQYTFHTTANFGGTTANDVLIDGNTNPVTALQNTLNNLVAAVNGGPGAGTLYGAGTTANADASASSQGTSVYFQATPAGNAVIAGGGSIAATVDTGTVETFLDTTPFASGSATSLGTATNAQAALTAINTAIQNVAAQRGQIGAGINRLQSASNVINGQTQNLTTAEDGIRAADIPQTIANLTKFSILEQTGVAALAQANQTQQLVLSLLR